MTKSPSMAQTMLWGMLIMALCFWMYSIAVALMRVRAIILERETHTEWVKQLDGGEAMNWGSPAEFFAMGGYALYVWGSFGVCALLMIVEPILARQASEGHSAQPAPRTPRRRTRQESTMKPRQKRIALIVGGLAAIGIAAALVLNALDSNIALVRHAQRGGRRQGAQGQGLPHRRHGQGRIAAGATT